MSMPLAWHTRLAKILASPRTLLWLIALTSGALIFWGLTRNGYANTYYAEAAQAASRSWKAWLTNAVDTSGSVSLDKGPLANMMMGLSGRLLGFSSFSMLLPEALCGVGSVLLLHDAVKRTLGVRAALLAALILALTPIFVAMSRFNNPDALLVLLEIAAAWALTRALQSGRTRHVVACGVLVGLAFNVKMLQAYLIVPCLAATLLIAGQGSVRRRLGQLLAGGVAMLAVSFAWYATMMLVPASSRPWVGDTTDNSWFSLIFGANGLSRVSGEGAGQGPGGGGLGGGLGGGAPGGGASGGGATFGGSAGLGRLFNSIVGGQIAWLLPLAALGLIVGMWARRRRSRTDLALSTAWLWGGWALVSWMVFSFSRGVFHPYYTTALAPAVAVLAADGLLVMWDRSRRSVTWSAMLAVALLGTAVLSCVLLDRASGFAPYLTPVVIALAAVVACLTVAGRLVPAARSFGGGRIASLTAVAGLVALLAGPTAYSLATVSKRLDGSNPLAGPNSGSGTLAGPGRGGPGGMLARGQAPSGGAAFLAGRPAGSPPAGVPGGAAPQGSTSSGSTSSGTTRPGATATGGPPSGAAFSGNAPGGGQAPGGTASKRLISYLEAHQGNAKYLVAAVGSNTAGAIALASSRDVIDMGGFMGSDPAPSLSKLKGFIEAGELHYVLLDGSGSGTGGPGMSGGSRSSSATSAIQARDAWIKAHGTVVHVPGESSTAGATLYYFAK